MGIIDTGVLSSLAAIVSADRVLTDEASLADYGGDETRIFDPNPGAVVLPADISQVQAVVRVAAAQQLAIVPSGGRTGLSGGAVALRGELILALDRLNAITDFNRTDRTARCGAGVTTQQLQGFAEQQGLYYPVDFASSGSSQIGGNVSTNAGGIKVIRYGMTRDWVAGLKLVTANGELLDLNRGLVKNNAGFDLRQLVIGAEGTLGVVVEATMRLTRPPNDLAVLLLAVPDVRAVLSVADSFRSAMDLSACEFFSAAALDRVLQRGGLSHPFARPSPFHVLLECEQGAAEDIAQVQTLFERCTGEGLVSDGIISKSEAQAATLWRLREDISACLAPCAPIKCDVSTLVSRLPDFCAEVEQAINRRFETFEIIWFGHIGDGNVHLNLLKPQALSAEDFQACRPEAMTLIGEIVQRHGGSVCAEHGVGLLKKDSLRYTRSDLEISLMRQIKHAFDPQGIMNPGKIFD